MRRPVPPARISSPASAPPAFQRDAITVACYALLAVLTVNMAMIGPLMPPLMAELGVGFATASFHSVAMAIGMGLAGGIGERVPHRIGRDGAVRVGLAALSAGVFLICMASQIAVSLAGAFFVGCGVSLVLIVAPATMVDRHGAGVAHAFGEANVVAYLGILAAPAIVSLMIILGSWRLAFVVPALLCVAFFVVFRKTRFGAPSKKGAPMQGAKLGLAYWCFWGLLFTSVSAENIIVIWSASFYEKQLGMERNAALWASTIYPVGMLVSRTAGIWLVRRFNARQMSLPSLAIALAGILLFLLAGSPWLGMAGMFVTALGMGCLYPFGITLAMAAVEGSTDTATARISLASAFSMITSPFITGAIADRWDLATAFIAVPVYILLAAIVTGYGLSLASRRASRE